MRKSMILKFAVLDKQPKKGDLIRTPLSGLISMAPHDNVVIRSDWQIVEPYGMDEDGNIELRPGAFNYETLVRLQLREDSTFIVLYDEDMKFYPKGFDQKAIIYKD